ncbi:MAG: DUF3006 domain-containing protein [Acidobacteria bacterium]|nr:DUF3006 domain-containing protein [Acidobacteriota bacterium]
MVKGERKERRGKSKQTRAVIDRMEDGEMAVLMVGKDGKTQVDVPASLLPDGASDGDHLIITINLDRNARATAEDRIQRLQDQLKQQGGAEDKKDFKL